MTQTERLINHFKTHGEIDPLTALRDLGIYRLGARIWDCKKAGHNIVNVSKNVINQFGERCRVGCYRMERAQ